MKLIYNPFSPFARKVLVVLTEKALVAQVEAVQVNPWDEPEALTAVNPISQVPVLVLEDGTSLFDSAVIAAYLDEVGAGPRLIPAGADQWRVRRTEAAADTICDSVVKLRQEGLRPEPQRSDYHVGRWRRGVARSLDALEAEGPGGGFDLGEIMLAIALDYIDLRQPDLNWRDRRPNLEARWRALDTRPSFRNTRPA